MHTRLCRHSVNNIKRVVVVESTYTTYAHSGSARGSTVSRDVHAWDTSLKCLDGVVLVLLLQLVNTHHRHGTCKVGLALCGITSHHHLLKACDVIHLHLHTVGSRQCQSLEAHVAKLQLGTGIDLNDKVAVKIGDCRLLCPYFPDSRAYERLSVSLAHYCSRNLYRLR